MVLKQLQNLRVIDQDITNDSYSTYCGKRTIQQLLDYGFILLDKPNGPTSHETVAWIKKILNIPKAGHSGTLDPMVSGILPVGLGEATKALIVLLLGPKEYHALGRLHTLPSNEKLQSVLKQFTVKIYDLVDAYAMWKEKNDDSKLRRILMPIEYVLSELKSVVIRDSAVDALCHGAQLAIPGILEISQGIAKGDFVGIYTQKGEVVALAE